MGTSLIKKLLVTMAVLGAAGSIVGAGTFASFNAVVTNSGNTFSTGFITFSSTTTTGACLSTNGGTQGGAACTTAFTSLTGLKAGDTNFGHLQLTNATSSLPVTINLTVTDTTPTALTNTNIGIGAAAGGSGANTPTNPNLGILIFECTDAGGTTDTDCAGGSTALLTPIYGTCTAATISHVGAVTSANVVPGTVNNNVTVAGTSCVGGNTAAAAYPLTIPIVAVSGSPKVAGANSLAATKTDSLATIVYLPFPAGGNPTDNTALQNKSANLSFAFTATQLAGTSS